MDLGRPATDRTTRHPLIRTRNSVDGSVIGTEYGVRPGSASARCQLTTGGGEMSVRNRNTDLKGRQTCRFLVPSNAGTAA